MRQYQVPQFITVEDKVLGPLTVKQSLYIGGGVVIMIGAWMIFETYLFRPIAFLVGAFAAALAFLKINGRPFPTIFKSAILFYVKPHLYIWKKEKAKTQKFKKPEAKKEEIMVKKIPKLSTSKLSDLAWSLDIQEKAGRDVEK